MSYVDQKRPLGRAPIAAVVMVHVAIGYAFYSGLAYNVITLVDRPIIATLLDDAPPPPPPNVIPPPQNRPVAVAPAERSIVDVPIRPSALDAIPTLPVMPATPDLSQHVSETPPPAPPAASQARGATPGPGRATWVTTDDYPAAALREGIEGSVGISVAIGADGRVTGCTVTASSGNAALDQATCRLYARRARFAPALDDAGKPIASTRPDRVRWTIPAQ